MAQYIAITETRSRVIVVDGTDSVEVAMDAVRNAYGKGDITLNSEDFIDEGGEHYEDETQNWAMAIADGYEVNFQHINVNDAPEVPANMSGRSYFGYEHGIMLHPGDPEYAYFSRNNPVLPHSFYPKDDGFVFENALEHIKAQMREFVELGDDRSYAIVSFQGVYKHADPEGFMDEANAATGNWMDYRFFKDKSKIIYSVCKINNQITEGFLEALLTETNKEV